jgi:branched-chain amino acid aminotransferase
MAHYLAQGQTMTELSETWTYFNNAWHEGNVPMIGPRTHALWLGSSVFDGARSFDGVSPDLDLHCARVNQSAVNLGLKATVSKQKWLDLVAEGLTKFQSKEAVYIRPTYWAESGGFMSVPPDPESTDYMLCMHIAPMMEPTGFSLTVSPFRRPTIETAPTNAKAGCLYPNNGRAIMEAASRGFENALILDMLGNVAETATSNIFAVKDGVVFTPVPNGAFLNGITRQRTIQLLREAGETVAEQAMTIADFLAADEIFSSGNYAKVVSVNRFEDRNLQPGPIAKRARELYFEWAHS